MKKDHYDKYTRAMAQQKKNKAENIERLARDRIENSCQLQLDIYKTMEDTDSLLEVLLAQKGKTNDNAAAATGDGSSNADAVSTTTGPAKTIDGKKSKNESTAIEELRTLNHQLHLLVFRLVSQLDEVNQESEMLRDKIKALERSNKSAIVHNVLPMRQVDIHHHHQQHHNNNDRQVHNVMIVPTTTTEMCSTKITSSSPIVDLDDNNDYVSLPLSQKNLNCEQSPSACHDIDNEVCTTEIIDDCNSSRDESSSDLPPLELPTFDFTTFDCKK